MVKGRPPCEALREAKAIACRQGKVCENARGRGLLYDFSVHLMLVTIAVTVRRTRVVVSDPDQIMELCRREIARLRKVPAGPVFLRELWIRQPDGTWLFFLVLDDLIVEIPPDHLPGGRPGGMPLRGDAPGPDRSVLPGGVLQVVSGFVCPFMATAKGG